jgi:Bacteriophage Sf6, terminase small subunit-like
MTIDKTKKKVGRPTDYNQELANLICERVATHEVGLKRLCAMYDDMPAKITINQWRNKYPEFAAQYAQAKISQIETLVEEIIDIADDSTQDEIINEQGARVCNSEFIARSRLRIDTRKWLAAKLIPRLYGDKDDALVNLKFPNEFKDVGSLLPMSAEVFRALGNQEITPGQARTLLGTLKDYSSSIAIIDLNQRMSKLLEGENVNHDTNEGEENA